MKGVSEIIAIILILMIVIALAALAYTWFSGIYKALIYSPKEVVAKTVIPNVSISTAVSFMKQHNCDSLFLWSDGSLHCMKNDCIINNYCKYIEEEIKG